MFLTNLGWYVFFSSGCLDLHIFLLQHMLPSIALHISVYATKPPDSPGRKSSNLFTNYCIFFPGRRFERSVYLKQLSLNNYTQRLA